MVVMAMAYFCRIVSLPLWKNLHEDTLRLLLKDNEDMVPRFEALDLPNGNH